MAEPYAIVVLVSGAGTNLQSLIDARAAGELPVAMRAVISNRPEAYALKRCRQAGIPALVIDHKGYPRRADFDAALRAAIEPLDPDLVVLAGFMRRLTGSFAAHFAGRMINLHPSLLPAYRGLRTYERCLADGVTRTGTSVHFVTPELDGGPVIARAIVEIEPSDNPETLKSRVQKREHQLLPVVLRWFSEGRFDYRQGRVYLDGKPLIEPLVLTNDDRLEIPHAGTGPAVDRRPARARPRRRG